MKYKSKNLVTARNAFVVAAAAATALALTGCLFSPPEQVPPEKAPEMTSPVNVLKNVVVAYNQKNIDLYKKALSPDFVFYFDPRDVGGNPPGSQYVIPESWSYTEDWQTTNNMFQKAYSINLSITTARVGEPEAGENSYQADNVPISLLVMVDELNGFIADKGYCNYEFESYPVGSEKYWRLKKWWDRTSEG